MQPRKKKRKRTAADGFLNHGIVLEEGSKNQMVGDCPFCSKLGHFYVNKEDGSWKCQHCGERGGLPQFLALKTKRDQERLRGSKAIALSRDRGIALTTLRAWRVGWDGEQYTIPVDVCGKLFDLRRYQIGRRLIATSGANVSLVGILDPESDIVWLCEGEWDGMVLWEVLQSRGEQGSVLSVTGATSFPSHAIPLFEGKHIKVVFDNDKEGRSGCLRVFNMLMGVAKTTYYVHWPEKFPESFDVRDLYKQRGKKVIDDIDQMLEDAPPGQVQGVLETKKAALDGEGLTSTEVIDRFREWLYLPNPEVLSVMFGAIFANRLDGDPIWIFFVAPPGGTKTEVLMALSDAPLILTTTTLTPHALMSGVRNLGGFDPSLIPKLNEKVLIVKDFTTILELPVFQREEIFSVLRDAYDGKTEKYFGNGVHRIYYSRFGILGGVTPIIEKYSAASTMLGERFLKYRLPHSGHIQTGGAIIRAALRNIAKESKMRAALKQVAHEVLNTPIAEEDIPELSELMTTRITKLAQWVSALRGVVQREKYTNIVQIRPTREVGTRIAKQLAKLGMGIAIFHRTTIIDESIYQIVVSVARSTVPDRTEEVIKHLYLRGREEFIPVKEVAKWSKLPEATIRSVLDDLALLGILQDDGAKFNKSWRLSRVLLRLMRPLGLYKREEAWHSAKVRSRSPARYTKIERSRKTAKIRRIRPAVQNMGT